MKIRNFIINYWFQSLTRLLEGNSQRYISFRRGLFSLYLKGLVCQQGCIALG